MINRGGYSSSWWSYSVTSAEGAKGEGSSGSGLGCGLDYLCQVWVARLPSGPLTDPGNGSVPVKE